jgi:hypothetical protein
MSNFNKKYINICLIILAVIILVGLTSCGEKGGIIFVENKRTVTYSVRISNTSGHSGASMDFDNFISPNKTEYFEIENDGTYWVLLNGIPYKEFSISGGETVHVTID